MRAGEILDEPVGGQPDQWLQRGPSEIVTLETGLLQDVDPDLRILMFVPLDGARERGSESHAIPEIAARAVSDDQPSVRPHVSPQIRKDGGVSVERWLLAVERDDSLFIEVIDHVVHDHHIERPFGTRQILEVVSAREDRVVEVKTLDRFSQLGKRIRGSSISLWLDGDHPFSSMKRRPQRPRTRATTDVEYTRLRKLDAIEQRSTANLIAPTIRVPDEGGGNLDRIFLALVAHCEC